MRSQLDAFPKHAETACYLPCWPMPLCANGVDSDDLQVVNFPAPCQMTGKPAQKAEET